MRIKTIFPYFIPFLFAWFALVTPAMAQLHAGVLGGMNLARLNYDPDDRIELSGRSGFGFGAVVDLGLGEDTELRLEPMFLQKGGTRTADGIDNEISLTYIEIPVLFRIHLSKSTIRPYMMVGPSFGIVMDATVKAPVEGVVKERDMKDEVQSLDFGLGFGAGLDVRVGKGSLFFEGRYALGSSNINDAPGTANPEVKTSGIQFFVGYTFFLVDI